MTLLDALLLLAVLSTGIIAGVFFAFSSFIMGALGRLAPAAGIAAMQSINVVVINPSFLGTFFGAGAVGAAAAILTLTGDASAAARVLAAVGAALYILGTLAVTMVRNVPLNNRLAAQVAESPEAIGVWRDYLRTWTRWNTIRTAAAAASCGCFTGATATL